MNGPIELQAMYHVSVHELAERVLAHIRREELLRPGDRVGVAVSGGIDSVALLRLVIELRQELGIVVSVVHFNHGLRGAESEGDQEFVAGLAREHGLEFYAARGDVARLTFEGHSGSEAAARELRYGFFRSLFGSAEVDEIESEVPQGLKSESVIPLIGTAEAVPFPIPDAAEAAPFQRQSHERALDKVITGHTLDDQAETVLMRVIRGTGLRGLGGIHPRLLVEREDGDSHGEIVRPLLRIRRGELEQYLADLGQAWREDSSNADSRFTRNRVRKLVLPLLEREFNPAVADGLTELAEIARDEEDYWENEISGWLGTVVQWSEPEWARGLPGFHLSQEHDSQALVQIQPVAPADLEQDAHRVDPKSVVEVPGEDWNSATRHGVPRSARDDMAVRLEEPGPAIADASVSRPWLLTEPRAVQRRVVKAIGEQAGIPLEFKHIEEILRFAGEDGPSGKELSLPLGWKVRREPEAVIFLTPDLRRQERIPDYEYLLAVPGRVLVPELGVVVEVSRTPSESRDKDAEYNPQELLRAESLPSRLMVRNWRAGDRFWPAHTKAPKKIKELLQERHVEQPQRRLWPVVVSGDEIVWMRGFPVPARLRAKAGEEAVLIRETAVDELGV